MAGIQRSRGCLIRMHPAGMRVVMYYDSPGEYFDERGESLTTEVARKAGFDVDKLAKQREKEKQLAAYKRKLDQQFAEQEELLAQAMSDGSQIQVKHVGGGQYALYSENQRLTKFALNKTEAETLLEDMQGGEDEKPETESPDSAETETKEAKTKSGKGFSNLLS